MSGHYLRDELYELVRTDPKIFEWLQSGSLDGIWYWDLEDLSQEWLSPRFWTTFGYDPEEMPHRSDAWQHLIHPDDLQTALANFNAHCADPSHPYDQLVRYRHADGSWVWVRCRGIVIRDDQGTPRRMLGAHNEVTPLKRAEEALAEANAELLRSNESLQAFASAASHDLQEPLRTITSFVELLEADLGDQLSDEQRRWMDFVTDAARRQSAQIRALLDYSRTSQSRPRTQWVELDQILKRVRDSCQAALERTGATLVCGPLPAVEADPTLVERVFQNLVSNAIKFGGKTIRVQAIEGGVEVVDDGIGFDPNMTERIFQVFKRLHSHDKYPGSGIGLSLCASICERHGWLMEAEGRPGDGATFRVLFG